jgi:hypothetical protein
MNHPRKPLLIWVWSQRGRRWVVDHEIRLDAANGQPQKGSRFEELK